MNDLREVLKIIAELSDAKFWTLAALAFAFIGTKWFLSKK